MDPINPGMILFLQKSCKFYCLYVIRRLRKASLKFERDFAHCPPPPCKTNYNTMKCILSVLEYADLSFKICSKHRKRLYLLKYLKYISPIKDYKIAKTKNLLLTSKKGFSSLDSLYF